METSAWITTRMNPQVTPIKHVPITLYNKQLQMLTFRAPLLQFSHLAQHGEPLYGEIKQFPAKCNHPSAKTQLRAQLASCGRDVTRVIPEA